MKEPAIHAVIRNLANALRIAQKKRLSAWLNRKIADALEAAWEAKDQQAAKRKAKKK